MEEGEFGPLEIDLKLKKFWWCPECRKRIDQK